MCRALAPDLVDLDEWGFPIVHDTEHADDATLRQLASVCPALALYLEPTHQ